MCVTPIILRNIIFMKWWRYLKRASTLNENGGNMAASTHYFPTSVIFQKGKLGGIRYEASSCGCSSPGSSAALACETSRRWSQILPGLQFPPLVRTKNDRFYSWVDWGAPFWGRTMVRSRPNEHSQRDGPPSNADFHFLGWNENPVGSSGIRNWDFWSKGRKLWHYATLAQLFINTKILPFLHCSWWNTRPLRPKWNIMYKTIWSRYTRWPHKMGTRLSMMKTKQLAADNSWSKNWKTYVQKSPRNYILALLIADEKIVNILCVDNVCTVYELMIDLM